VTAVLRCRICERTQPLAPQSVCSACDGPLDVDYDLLSASVSPTTAARSMWRYGDLLPHRPADRATPGLTPLVPAPRLSNALEIELLLKLEGANPTHSFKDRIAATAVAAAQAFGLETLCCASTGNLGEAVAARAAAAGLEAVVLCPADDLAVAPTASYGARVFGIAGSFDECRALERQLEGFFPWGFLGGNLHALASEGAKTIAFEIVEQLGGQTPDAVVSPVASGTLFAKLAQGFDEALAVGLSDGGRPRLFGAQAGGCPPLAAAWADDRPPSRVRPQTEVRSLAIGDPAFGDLAVGAARMSGGAIHCVQEDEIADRTALLAETTGILADSAGGVALGSLIDLVRNGTIPEGSRVVLVVTGTGLKPYPVGVDTASTDVAGDVESLLAALGVD
jgi:threonine synthase